MRNTSLFSFEIIYLIEEITPSMKIQLIFIILTLFTTTVFCQKQDAILRKYAELDDVKVYQTFEQNEFERHSFKKQKAKKLEGEIISLPVIFHFLSETEIDIKSLQQSAYI